MNVRNAVLLAMLLTGCTTNATKQAIQNYQKVEDFKQLAFNNSTRVANNQMLLNLQQYVESHKTEPDKILAAINVTWDARNQLEVTREQYLYGRSLTMLTVGQYLYNQQGILNVWVEGKSDMLGISANSTISADKATGVNSVKDLIPNVDNTSSEKTRPNGLSIVQEMLWQIYGK